MNIYATNDYSALFLVALHVTVHKGFVLESHRLLGKLAAGIVIFTGVGHLLLRQRCMKESRIIRHNQLSSGKCW
jgi:hypothetical protein